MFDTIEEVYEHLKAEGQVIRAEADGGCERAQRIMKYYRFHEVCPGDKMGQCLVIDEVNERLKQKEKA